MKKTIFRKVVTTAGQPKTFRVEGARYPYSAKMTWSRSTPGSKLTLHTGCAFNPKFDLGSYSKDHKEYVVDLSRGDLVFCFPTEIVLETTGKASVLIALECEFPNTRKRSSAVQEPAEVVVTELPVVPVMPTEN